MQRQRSLRHQHQSRTQQFDLFGEPDGDGAVQSPEWQALPNETRQALTDLMVRMILDHAQEACRPQPEERRHDV
jgi:hypothetical protein